MSLDFSISLIYTSFVIYLERNAEIIGEINKTQSLIRGKEVGASSKTTTTSVSYYESVVVGAPLHMVLKESFSNRNPLERVTHNLAFAALIYDQTPSLREELPLFIGLAIDKIGKPIGELTEDFTRGGQYRIRDLFKDEVARMGSAPQDLRMLIGGEYKGSPCLLSDAEMAHMFFEVWTEDVYQRRLGDFDTAWGHMSGFGNPPLDLLDTVTREINRYTVVSQLKGKFEY